MYMLVHRKNIAVSETCLPRLPAFKLQLAEYDLDQGWFNDRLKDTSDSEWRVFSNHSSSLVPWLIIHFIGSRFLKKNNVKVSLEPISYRVKGGPVDFL